MAAGVGGKEALGAAGETDEDLLAVGRGDLVDDADWPDGAVDTDRVVGFEFVGVDQFEVGGRRGGPNPADCGEPGGVGGGGQDQR